MDTTTSMETPPRTWGGDCAVLDEEREHGNTPTNVGRSSNYCRPGKVSWKHPHERGEEYRACDARDQPPETPPRTWGGAWPDTGTPAKPIALHVKQGFFMTEDQQANVQKRLVDEFGMSIDGAEGLAGAALDAWIEQAEDACMWVVQTWTPEENQRRPSSWSPFP